MRNQTVFDVMTKDPVTVGPDTPFKEIVRILDTHGISAVPVVDHAGELLGVVSETDLVLRAGIKDEDGPRPWLRRGAQRDWDRAHGAEARDLMTPNPVVVRPGTPVPRAARTLAAAGIRRVYVVSDDDGRLVGVVSRRDLLRPFLRDDAAIVADVHELVLRYELLAKPSDVEVTAENGVVTLDGRLQRRSAADIAVRLTRALPGVVDVVDNLGFEWDDVRASLGTDNAVH